MGRATSKEGLDKIVQYGGVENCDADTAEFNLNAILQCTHYFRLRILITNGTMRDYGAILVKIAKVGKSSLFRTCTLVKIQQILKAS